MITDYRLNTEVPECPGRSVQPDATFAAIHQNQLRNFGHGEVKPSPIASDLLFQYCLDFVRLGKFSKDALHYYLLNNTICFQAVGRKMVFYIVTYTAEGMYTMLEIGSLLAPISIKDLVRFLDEFDDILNIMEIYYSKCIPEKNHLVNKDKLKFPSTNTPKDKQKYAKPNSKLGSDINFV